MDFLFPPNSRSLAGWCADACYIGLWPPCLAGRRKKSISEVSEGVPVGEFVIALGTQLVALLQDDEFDKLLLEVIVLGKAQSTAEKKGLAWLPSCHGDEAIHVFLSFRRLVSQRRRQTDGYEG